MPYATTTYHPTSHGVYRKRYDYERQTRRQKVRVPLTTSTEPMPPMGAGDGFELCCIGLEQKICDQVAKTLTGEDYRR